MYIELFNSHASYLTTHGIAAHMKSDLSDKLKTNMFLINADEATNEYMNRIFHVFVFYFDDDMRKVVTQHMASRKVNIADALHTDRHSLVIQPVGILLDNCSVMKGRWSGDN